MTEVSDYGYLFEFADDSVRLWNERAGIPGLGSVMSLGKPEDVYLRETQQTKAGLYEELGDLSEKSVLEIGTGIGRFTSDLAAASARLVSVDLSRKMLERARKLDLRSASLIQAVGQKLPLKDNSFDVVFESTVLIHVTDDDVFDEFIGEAMRVLKPNGTILFCGPISKDEPVQKHPYLRYRAVSDYENACGITLLDNRAVNLTANEVHFLSGIKPNSY